MEDQPGRLGSQRSSVSLTCFSASRATGRVFPGPGRLVRHASPSRNLRVPHETYDSFISSPANQGCMEGSRSGGVRAVILLSAAILVASAAALVPPAHTRFGTPDVHSLATSVRLGYNGVSPFEIFLNWTPSQDTCFQYMALQMATAGASGPFVSLDNYTGPFTQAFIDNAWQLNGPTLTANTTYWWRVLDGDCNGVAASNVLEVKQPPVARLTVNRTSKTSVELHWTNAAKYSQIVIFQRYEVYVRVGSGPTLLNRTIKEVGNRSLTFTGLSQSTNYMFVVATVDGCSICGGMDPNTTTDSNLVQVSALAALGASVSASASPTVGAPVTLTCTSSGGAGPYAYAWSFGDGSQGTGSPTTHTYTRAGTVNATCTVTDVFGDTASDTTAISIQVATSPPPPSPPSSTPTTPGVDARALGLIGVAIGAVAAIAFLLLRRRKRGSARPPGPAQPGP